MKLHSFSLLDRIDGINRPRIYKCGSRAVEEQEVGIEAVFI